MRRNSERSLPYCSGSVVLEHHLIMDTGLPLYGRISSYFGAVDEVLGESASDAGLMASTSG